MVFRKNSSEADPVIPTNHLCVNPKKVSELQEWITKSQKGQTHPILLLSGPPGCGKETSVRSVCAEQNLALVEWKNRSGVDEWADIPSQCTDYETMTDEECVQFVNFVHSSTMFGGGVVLVKEFPHAFETRRDELQQLLLKTANGRCPLIFVTNNPRNFPDLMSTADHIQFLKVAKTFMKKALNRMPSIKLPPNLSEVLEVADGDIRAAINTIKFNAISTSSKDSKSSCSAADTQLLLFRALGRILNSKRESIQEPPVPACLPEKLRRNQLTYPVPEEQCTLSGFMPTTFSSFLHQNMIPFIDSISTHDKVLSDMSISDCFSKKYGHEEKLSQYQAVISCRSLSFWNANPNKVGFIALHRPRLIEHRKTKLINMSAIGTAKFNSLRGSSTASVVTMELPAIAKISPRHVLSMQFAEIINFPKFISHNGKRLDEKDDVREIDNDDEPVPIKSQPTQKEDHFENDLHISDDSDW